MIPYGRQWIDDADIAAVTEALKAPMLTGGTRVEAFETAFGETVDAPHVAACANGTAALHLAMLALGVGRGDIALVPSVTFLATANAAELVGATVRFVDVDAETGLMTPQTLREALARDASEDGVSGAPRVVAPVHLNGQAVDLDGVASVAREHGLAIVEDACHALGGKAGHDNSEHRVGASVLSDLSCFSFHPVKTIAMGEGGAVTTRDPALAERLFRLRNHGMIRDPQKFLQTTEAFDEDGAPTPWYYEMPEVGLNYRVSDIHCALGLSQLRRLPGFLSRRRALAAAYEKRLAKLAPVLRPIEGRELDRDGWHLYVVRIDFDALGLSRAQVMRALAERGVGTQVHYRPVHRQPYYAARSPAQVLPGADAYYQRCLSLPLFASMTDAEQDHVIAALEAVLTQ